jgi:hypothetical protein
VAVNREERMTAVQALQHIWITGKGEINEPLTMNDMMICFKSQ